jgi:hypothetical protein
MTFRMTFLAAVTAATALGGLAAPAFAQDYRYDRGGYDQRDFGDDQRGWRGDDLRAREERMRDWIGRSADQGEIGPGNERRALDFLDRVQRGEQQMRWRNGGFLRPDQRDRVSAQLDHLVRFMRQARND